MTEDQKGLLGGRASERREPDRTLSDQDLEQLDLSDQEERQYQQRMRFLVVVILVAAALAVGVSIGRGQVCG